MKVRRGYADDGMVTVTGRDGSDALRKVDIDALYGEYLAAGKGCTMSASQRVLDLKNGAHILK